MLGEQLTVDVGDLAAEALVKVFAERKLEAAPPREALRSGLDAGAYERVGELGPGDADLDVLEL